MEAKRNSWKKWLWYFSLTAAAILLYKLCDNITQIGTIFGEIIGILAPFIGGFALAFLLYGPCNWLEKQLLRWKGRFWKTAARPLSLTIVYLLLLGVLVLMLSLLLPSLISSLTSLITSIPQYIGLAKDRLDHFIRGNELLEGMHITQQMESLYPALLTAATKLFTTENVFSALRGVASATTSMVDGVITVVVSVYMLAGRERLLRESKAVLGLFIRPRRLATLSGYSHRVSAIFYAYFYGALMDALVVGAVVSIGLLIFRVPYAVLLGMSLGLLNMIPYFGAIIGTVGIVLITLLTKNIYAALGVLLYIIVVQQLDANVVQPRVVGGSVGLRPIYVLLGITVFGGLFGFWGIFLGVPLMAIVQMLVKDAIAHRRSAADTGNKDAADPPAPAETSPKADG